MLKWEIKKIIKNKNAIIIAIIFLLNMICLGFIKPELEDEKFYINEKYQKIQDQRSKEEIGQEKFDKKIAILNQVAVSKNYNEYGERQKNMARKTLSKDLNQEYKNGKSNQTYEDVSFYKVFSFRISHPILILVMIMISVFIFSNIYVDEKISSVDVLILSSKNKFKVLYSKVALSLIIPMIIYGLAIIIIFIITKNQYNSVLGGNLQVFRIVDTFTLLKEPIKIIDYVLLKMGVVYIMISSISMVSVLFSFITSTSIESTSMIFGFLGIGKIIGILSFLPNKIRFIASNSNYFDLTFKLDKFVAFYMGDISVFGHKMAVVDLGIMLLVATLGIGMTLCFYVCKKVLTR